MKHGQISNELYPIESESKYGRLKTRAQMKCPLLSKSLHNLGVPITIRVILKIKKRRDRRSSHLRFNPAARKGNFGLTSPNLGAAPAAVSSL